MFAVQGMGASLLHAIKQSSVVLTTVLGGKLFTENICLEELLHVYALLPSCTGYFIDLTPSCYV